MVSLAGLWLRVRGIRPSLPPLRGDPPAADVPDSHETVPEPEPPIAELAEPPRADDLPPIAGLFIQIEYQDAAGVQTARRITCRDICQSGANRLLRAHCHERDALRSFRIDRIRIVVDPETGEVLEPTAFFAAYVSAEQDAFATYLVVRPGRERSTSVAAFDDLSNAQRYDLIAGLKVLSFLAHCDADWHLFEDEEIAKFVWEWWAGQGLDAEPDIGGIMAYVRRLRPRPDDFYVSLKRASRNRRLGDLLLRAVTAVVEADGEIRSAEHRWVCELQGYLAELAGARLAEFVRPEARP